MKKTQGRERSREKKKKRVRKEKEGSKRSKRARGRLINIQFKFATMLLISPLIKCKIMNPGHNVPENFRFLLIFKCKLLRNFSVGLSCRKKTFIIGCVRHRIRCHFYRAGGGLHGQMTFLEPP